ncbi:hypothetical protein QTG54_005355, partial [Skeletonema marinoi]
GDTITENYLSDASLGTIAKSCPNLQYFAYKISSGYYYKEELDGLSGKGILALVSDCRRLEVLELENAKRVGRETFVEILQMLALARETSAVAKAVVSDDDGTFALVRLFLRGTHSSLQEIHFFSKIPLIAIKQGRIPLLLSVGIGIAQGLED